VQFIQNKLVSVESADYILVDYLKQQFISVVNRIEKASAKIGSLCVTCVPTLLQLGLPDLAYSLVCSVTKTRPHDSRCWRARMELEIKLGKPHKDILVNFENAVKLSSADVCLWSMYIQWLVGSGLLLTKKSIVEEVLKVKSNAAVTEVATRCLKSVFSSLKVEEYSTLKTQLLDTIFFHYGIEYARFFIQQSLSAPPNTLEYYMHCIAVEEVQPPSLSSSLQLLYERAVQEYGSEQSSEDVWLGYINMESRQLRMDRAADIYWRAKKALSNPESFISRFEGSNKLN